MGQEAGKHAWPKSSGGCKTITGRRYGRRHAYISFRPTQAKQPKTTSLDSQPDLQEMEMDSVQGDSPIWSISSVLQAMFPANSNSVHPEQRGEGGCTPSRKDAEVCDADCRMFMCDGGAESEPNCAPVLRGDSAAHAWPQPEDREGSSAPNFVSIDSFEPESSEGEEGDGSDVLPGLKRLDDMICELGKQFEYLSDLQSYLSTNSREEDEALPEGASMQRSAKESVREEKGFRRSMLSNAGGTRQKHAESSRGKRGFHKTVLSNTSGTVSSGSRGDSPEKPDDKPEAGTLPSARKSLECRSHVRPAHTEMVVRPKVRRQAGEKREENKRPSQPEGACEGLLKQSDGEQESAPPPTLNERQRQQLASAKADSAESWVGPLEDAEGAGALQKSDEDLWEDLQHFGRKWIPVETEDDSSSSSSVCSEGELSGTWSSALGAAWEPHSASDSWETLPGFDESELEVSSSSSSSSSSRSSRSSSSSSSLDDVPELNFIPEDQAPLEEGEIPWQSYHSEVDDNSSGGGGGEGDPGGASRFVSPALFMLDGNNNFEDDSSVSEDLDGEWRVLDFEFGEGFGMAQAISFVDPQLLSYMALEERLAQAMEAALAHLESLAVDGEQAHPPASEDVITCLPQITVLDDCYSKEQNCAICCSEYVKDEIATQLPCCHLFHKACVTLWLRKSGTCPVCRHVLSPALRATPPPASFVSDQDAPPSDHSTVGTR